MADVAETVAKWSGLLSDVIEQCKSAGTIEDGELMKTYLPQFAEISEVVVEAYQDGFQLSDLSVLGTEIPKVMKIASTIEGASGEQKRQFVVDSVWVIYHSIDTGPDGNANRIKVPFASWLSSFGFTTTEEKVERFILKIATEFVIDGVYGYMKEKDEV